MQLNPILKFLSHFFLWLIPAFLLWWVSANSIIIPGLRVVVAKTADIWFYKEQVQLHDAPGDKWFIRTNLIAKPLPQDGNQYRRWTIFFQPILIYTIGFPLLWAWFLATPQRRIFNQIVGNSIIFLLTALALWLKVFYVIANVMATGATTQYMTSFGILQPVPNYNLWLVGLIAHIQFLLFFRRAAQSSQRNNSFTSSSNNLS